ncbi:MAG: sigma 54-interacting transcriptional regulator [Myxococcales bacterium]|nr:sigma 54-interacting transcriptional regulator [Myxococcales bacterium]
MKQRRGDQTATLGEHALSARAEGSLEVMAFYGDWHGTRPLIPGEPLRVGRGPEVGWALGSPSLSKKHLEFRCDGLVTVEDLGSKNGTSLGGRRLRMGERAPVRAGLTEAPGDWVEAGGVVFCVRRLEAAELAGAQGALGAAPVVLDPAMVAVYETAARLAMGELSVLVTGETGVGKARVAEAIHRASPRRGGPFVAVRCAALPPSQVESALFGHRAGASEGATQDRAGSLALADGGTLFFDEVAELSLPVQAKLVQALEARAFAPLGAETPQRVDVRVVASTHRDLVEAVRAGQFREDLYFRLCGAEVRVPPLRARRGEVRALAAHFLASKTPERALSEAAAAELLAHPWPGNVRELKNVIDRAVLLAPGREIEVAHLLLAAPDPPSADPPSADPTAADDPRSRIVAALQACAWNQTRAAARLGISRRTLVTRLRELNIPRPRGSVSE